MKMLQSSRFLFQNQGRMLAPLAYQTFRQSSTCSTSGKPFDFQAWRVAESEDGGTYQGHEQTVALDEVLPLGDILIRVSHSSLNYKDALSAAGNKGVTRKYPHTPGVDAAGKIVEIRTTDGGVPTTTFRVGDSVIVTGYDLGMNTPGGFGEYIRVPANWCIRLPTPWDPRTAMVYGTAGLTAALCIQKLLLVGGAKPPSRVAVTGASGSVGSIAVELLSKLGFQVIAISGKDPQRLRNLGAVEVLPRETLQESQKPLLKANFPYAIDTVGGSPLAELLKQIQPGGSVACCGNAAGVKVETSVLPFILRGINLLGVDSVEIPLEEKANIWTKLSGEWRCPKAEQLARDIGRHELDVCLKAFLVGESSGKIILDHSLTKY
jgi:putative YhdH/YhfP family quinone oxidoreductase